MKKRMSESIRPNVESLEERALMAASIFNGVVTIDATEGADQVTVRIERQPVNRWAGIINVFDQVVVRENGLVTGRFAASGVHLIEFYGKGGNDSFQNDTAIRSYAEGGLGRDTLIGGSYTDEFYGGQDNDHLMGRGGLDYMSGEAGNDRMDGGIDGHIDEMLGGIGADTFVAERSGISIYSKQNRDTPLDFNALEGDTIDWGLVAQPVLSA